MMSFAVCKRACGAKFVCSAFDCPRAVIDDGDTATLAPRHDKTKVIPRARAAGGRHAAVNSGDDTALIVCGLVFANVSAPSHNNAPRQNGHCEAKPLRGDRHSRDIGADNFARLFRMSAKAAGFNKPCAARQRAAAPASAAIPHWHPAPRAAEAHTAAISFCESAPLTTPTPNCPRRRVRPDAARFDTL